MAIAGIIPVAKWVAKIKQRSDAGCNLCKRASEQHGLTTKYVFEETYGPGTSDPTISKHMDRLGLTRQHQGRTM
jgi:hypothetical protein